MGEARNLLAVGWPLAAVLMLMLWLVSRGDDYRRSQRTTSPFIPWFPRRDGEGR